MDADSGSAMDRGVKAFSTFHVEAGDDVFELFYTRFDSGQVEKGVEKLPE